jgi:hypothetical protein
MLDIRTRVDENRTFGCRWSDTHRFVVGKEVRHPRPKNKMGVWKPRHVIRWPMTLILDSDATPDDLAGRHPAVDPTAIIADLKPVALEGLDQVEIFSAVDLA